MPGDGRLRLEELPPDLQNEVSQAAGVKLSKKPRAKRPHKVSRGDIIRASALVMNALNKSKLPPSAWYRVLGQCQRWTHSPDRMGAKAKSHR